jgi:hypothetical protein
MRRNTKRLSTVALAAVAGCCLLAGAADAVGATVSTADVARQASSAAPGGRWTAAVPVPGLAKLNVGHQAMLNDIACASGGNCAAGGFYTDRAGHDQAWIASEVGGTWHPAEEVPGTPRLDAGGDAAVNLVSCLSPGDCLAIGEAADAEDHGRQSPFVVTEAKAGSWTTARPIAPDLAAAAIACPRAGDCVVAGQAAGHASVTAEHGAAWSASRTLPGVNALGPLGSTVGALTCTSPGNCVAGGTYDPPGAAWHQVFVASEVRGAWQRAVEVPGTARLNAGGDAQISAISCASAGNCAIGGFYSNSAGDYFTFVANEVRGQWDAARSIPGTVDPTDVGGSSVVGLRCTAAATCLAVGGFGADGFIAVEQGGTWGKIRLVPDLTGYGTSLSAVACQSAGNCLVTGSAQLDSGDDSYDAGAESFTMTEIKGAWTKPRVLTVADGGQTDSVALSCDRDGHCSVGGTIQYGISYQTAPAPFSAYVAGYAPEG